jgi:hypothetical protein
VQMKGRARYVGSHYIEFTLFERIYL